MEKVLLALSCVLLLLGIILNALHLMSVIRIKQKLKAAELARILPSGFMILMSISILPLELYTVNSPQDNNMVPYDRLRDKFDVFDTGTFLGLNLLLAITKLRSYRCSGHAHRLISRKSIVIPTCVICFASLLMASSSFLHRPLHMNMTSLNTTSLLIGFAAEMIFYHALEIIPTVVIYTVMLVCAFRYHKKASLAFSRQNRGRSSSAKQFKSIWRSIQIYLATFTCPWLAFILFKVFCLKANEKSTLQMHQNLILCAKLAMFALNPVGDGLLQKRNRKKITTMILNLRSSDSSLLNARDNRPELCRLTDRVKMKICKHNSNEENQNDGSILENENFTIIPSIKLTNEHMTDQIEIDTGKITEDVDTAVKLCVRRLNYSLPLIEPRPNISRDSSVDLSPYPSISRNSSADGSPFLNNSQEFSFEMLPNPLNMSPSHKTALHSSGSIKSGMSHSSLGSTLSDKLRRELYKKIRMYHCIHRHKARNQRSHFHFRKENCQLLSDIQDFSCPRQNY